MYRVTATQDDPRQRKPDISLAKRVLHWEPQVTVDDGLAATVSYFADELGLAVATGSGLAGKSYQRADAAPVWIATAVNEYLTADDKGLNFKKFDVPKAGKATKGGK